MPAVQSREKTRIKSCGPGTPPFTRNKVGTPGRDEILVDFPVGAHNCALAMGEAASGLGNIDGKNCYRNSTTTSKVKLVDERRYAVLLKVRRIGEAAAIDVLLDSHPQLRTQSPSEEVKRETLGLLTLGRQFVAALTSSARPLGDCPRQTNCRKAAQTEASDNDGTDISGGGPASAAPRPNGRKFRRTRSSSRLRRGAEPVPRVMAMHLAPHEPRRYFLFPPPAGTASGPVDDRASMPSATWNHRAAAATPPRSPWARPLKSAVLQPAFHVSHVDRRKRAVAPLGGRVGPELHAVVAPEAKLRAGSSRGRA